MISWYRNFGDGSTNTDQAQNQLHAYTNNGPFFPSLVAINNNGATIIGSGPVIDVIYPSSILNGGFETGTSTNWTNTGSTAISTAANYRHSGTYGAQLSANGALGYLRDGKEARPDVEGEIQRRYGWERDYLPAHSRRLPLHGTRID
jgi:PKD repeat protein